MRKSHGRERAFERAAVPLRSSRPALECAAGRAFPRNPCGGARGPKGTQRLCRCQRHSAAGLPNDFYNRIGELADRVSAHFVLDASGRIAGCGRCGQRPPYAYSWTREKRSTLPEGRSRIWMRWSGLAWS